MKMRKKRSKLWLLLLAAVCSMLFSATAFAAIEVTMSGTSNYADAYEAFLATNEQRTKAGKKALNMNLSFRKLLCCVHGKQQCWLDTRGRMAA